MTILRFLQTVDRRVLYALLLLSVTLPFFLSVRLPMKVSPATESLYNAIDALHPGDFVLLGTDWDGGTKGENSPETFAVMQHLMRKKLRFGVLCFSPQSPTLVGNIARSMQQQYGYQEGVNWVNFGYKVDAKNFFKGFVQDIPSTIPTDTRGIAVASLPAMNGIHSAADIKFVMVVTPTSLYQTYIQFVAGPRHIPIGLAPTSVMIPEAFNYLDSGQLIGMVPGLVGAGEYESKLQSEYPDTKPSKASAFSNSASFAHLLIIAFILLGNVAMILERRQRRRMGGVE